MSEGKLGAFEGVISNADKVWAAKDSWGSPDSRQALIDSAKTAISIANTLAGNTLVGSLNAISTVDDMRIAAQKMYDANNLADYFEALADFLSSGGALLTILPMPQAKIIGASISIAGTVIKHGIDTYKQSGNVNDISKPTETIPNIEIPSNFDINDLGDVRIDPKCNANFNKSVAWRPRKDPLTLDLDGDGIETIAPSTTNPIYFDHDADGVKSSTGWISADDGFLVMDRNGNGTIDDGTELFGDATPVVDPGTGITYKAADGFAALKAQDTNNDGKVDSSDANWSQLRVWRDLNQDGVSQANELFTLDALGIGSIKVAKTANSQTLTNGNQIADLGSYTKTDGSQGTLGEVNKMAEVNLIEDTFHSVFTDQIPLADGVTDLPEMLGSGKVRDLHQAASQSTELKDLLSQFSQAATRQDERAILDQLLGAWADTSGMYKTLQEHVNPNHDPMGFVVSYQQFGNVKMSDYENQVGSVSSVGPEWQPIVDAWEKKLHILEAFNGRYFFNLPNDSVPGGIGGAGISSSGGGGGGGGIAAAIQLTIEFSQQQIDLLSQSYDALKESVYTALLLQTRFKPLFDQVNLQIDSNGIKLDYSSLEQEFRNRIASNPAQGLTDLIEFNRYAGNMLGGGWYGNEFAAEIIDSLDNTTVLQAVYADLGVGLSDKNKGTTEQDYIYGGTGNDNIASNAGNDVVFGGLGNDSLDGGSGDDQLLGGAGDDSLTGSYGDDTIVGGTGNDLLYGGVNAFNNGFGNDTYRFSVGDGVDTISDSDSTTGNTDTIEFTNVASAALRGVERQGNNLVIKYGTADQITVLNQFGGPYDGIEKIKFSDGAAWDKAAVYAAVVINGTTGNDNLSFSSSTSRQRVYGLAGDDTLVGGSYDDILDGGVGNDSLNGGGGNDVLQGDDGNDALTDASGNNLFNGGANADMLTGGIGSELFIGGAGNDNITTGTGADIVAFNRGDGQDTVMSSTGKDNTVSLGGGITYADLAFTKSSSDLILTTGAGEKITFKDWYANANNRSIANLQLVVEGSSDYDATSTDPMHNKKIEQFNFDGLASAFDQAQTANPTLTNWSLSSSMLNFYLGGSDTAAIGGDLAYQYAKNGSLSAISVSPAQMLLGNAQFGAASQNLQSLSALQDTSAKLA